MRKIVFALLLVASICSQAQNDFFFSHYMFNPTYYNPAWLGEDESAFVALNYRNQWTGYSTTFDGSGGAPNTQLFSVAVPVKTKFISGMGLNVSNDNLGPVNNFEMKLSASFSLNLKSGVLRLGVQPELFSKTLDFNRLSFVDPSDRLNIGSSESQLKADVTAGIFYSSNKNFQLGVSVANLLRPSFDFGLESVDFENIQERSYLLHGGTKVKLSADLSVAPSIIFRSNLNEWTFDMSAIVMYRERMWSGLSFRKQEAIIVYIGYAFLKDLGLKAGYSFDFVLANREAKQVSSNEIFVRFDLPDFVFGGRKAVKTPRFPF